MKRILPFLIVLLTLTLNCWLGQDDVSETELSVSDTETVWQCDEQQPRQAALLSDASHLYRICNTRPQRLISSHGAKNERITGKLPFALRYKQRVTLDQSYGGRPLLFAVAFHFAASCDYYVYALRRILR